MTSKPWIVELGSWSSVIGVLLPFMSMLGRPFVALPGPPALIGEHFVPTAVEAYGPLALLLDPAVRRQ
jgi:hypothetical protein